MAAVDPDAIVVDQMTCNEDGTPCKCTPFAAPRMSHSIKVDLSDGETKYICVCGASKKFPFCDGSHRAVNADRGTTYKSVPVNKEQYGDRIGICACGHSKNRDQQNEDGSWKVPRCDGQHRNLKKLEGGAAVAKQE